MPDTLIDAARQVMAQSYSPYSKLRVGAAIQSRDGTVFVGTNIENASYGHTICAERVALFAAVSAGHRSFDKIAVVTDSPHAVSPCGACRQVLAEFGLDLHVSLSGRNGEVQETCLADLLPHAFTPNDLPHE